MEHRAKRHEALTAGIHVYEEEPMTQTFRTKLMAAAFVPALALAASATYAAGDYKSPSANATGTTATTPAATQGNMFEPDSFARSTIVSAIGPVSACDA